MKARGFRRAIIWGLSGMLVLAILTLFSILNNVGYGNVKQIIRLERSGHSIIQMDNPSPGRERYLTKDENDPQERLKSRMQREGWKYQQQEGSGYFFIKEGKQEIVTTRKWNHFYILYDLNAGIANLED
ncbi:hypothetical protein AB4Z30_18240 [Paenibacillus sp. 2TAF8]|uniref:hypothetical protein n=1 Tax=Paenibacillus sp. 2TAF8 TaxID=3233020 RepID=UPI003F956C1B